MSLSKLLLLFLISYSIALSPLSAHATSIDSETSVGSSTTAESLTLSGNLDTSDTEKYQVAPHTNWTVGITTTKTKSTDATTNTELTDVTNDYTAGLERRTTRRLIYGFDLNYSRTPDENLVEFGPDFTAGRTWILGKKTKGFTQTLDTKLVIASNLYTQSSSASSKSRARRVIPKKGESSITQD